MKKGLLIGCYFVAQTVLAQSFSGHWTGTFTGPNGSVTSEMNLKAVGSQLSGTVAVIANGQADAYALKGSFAGNLAKGELTYSDGTVFDFTMTQNKGSILQKVSYAGKELLQGTFTQPMAPSAQNARPSAAPDKLYRDPKLVGQWTYSENYSSSGGFYGGVESTIVLNADGSIDDGGSASYASGGGNSTMNKGAANETIAQMKALGARWYTKGAIFCWRLNVNGKLTDVESARYYYENGSLLLTDLQTGKKTLYRKK